MINVFLWPEGMPIDREGEGNHDARTGDGRDEYAEEYMRSGDPEDRAYSLSDTFIFLLFNFSITLIPSWIMDCLPYGLF